jgi:hypothetical protein
MPSTTATDEPVPGFEINQSFLGFIEYRDKAFLVGTPCFGFDKVNER